MRRKYLMRGVAKMRTRRLDRTRTPRAKAAARQRRLRQRLAA